MAGKEPKRAQLDPGGTPLRTAEQGGVSLLQTGEAGRQVALHIARVAMGLDPMNGYEHFYRASDGVLGLIVDDRSFEALGA